MTQELQFLKMSTYVRKQQLIFCGKEYLFLSIQAQFVSINTLSLHQGQGCYQPQAVVGCPKLPPSWVPARSHPHIERSSLGTDSSGLYLHVTYCYTTYFWKIHAPLSCSLISVQIRK